MAQLPNPTPLIEQAQAWWQRQHAGCPGPRDPMGGPSDSLSWLYTHGDPVEEWPCPLSCGWRGDRSVEQLADDLSQEFSVQAVRAAGLVDAPDAQVAELVAGALLPQPYGDAFTLVVDVVKAASAKTVQARDRALVGALVAGGLLLIFAGVALRRT